MKKETINNKHFKAKDFYSQWSKYCKAAENNIDVISPYVDNTVKNLLSSKHIKDGVIKSIYTRIDSDTIFEKPYQIRALINCIKKDINIYQIDDLHSKTLIIDKTFASVGSQNFTSAGRKNKETSMMSLLNLKDSKFLLSVLDWMTEAEEITIEYLLKLEAKLKIFRPDIKKLREDHKLIFEQIKSEEILKKRMELLKNLLILKSRTKTSFASEYIYLTKTYIDNWESSITTFLADSGKDLRRWKIDGMDNDTSLVRLNYYPCVHTSNNSIAFVRLAKTRISKYSTNIGLGSYYIGETYYRLSVRCPKKDTTKVNFKIILNNWRTGENELDFYFNGAIFDFIDGKYASKDDKDKILDLVIKKTKIRTELLKRCFKGHNMEAIGGQITNFFDGWWYKLYIVDYFDNPIIIAEKRK